MTLKHRLRKENRTQVKNRKIVGNDRKVPVFDRIKVDNSVICIDIDFKLSASVLETELFHKYSGFSKI